MCADNFSGRQSQREGRHRRNSLSRQQVTSMLAMRLIESLTKGQAVSPPARSTQAVGRVGALAVALGIGTAILGFTPVAAADRGAGDSAGQESSRSADPSPRRGASAGPGSDADAAGAPSKSAPKGRAARSGRASGTVEPDAIVDIAPRRTADAPAPSASVAKAPAAAIDPAPADIPDAEPIVIEELAPVEAVAPAVDVVAPEAGSVRPESTVVAPVEIADAPNEAPVMTAAAPAGALSEGDVDPTSLLGEDGTPEPGAEPLAWAAMAVTRREDLAGATPETAPAATVGTGETVDPIVGAREIAITSVSPDAAQPGDTITITGTGFYPVGYKVTPVSKVYFGCDGKSSTCQNQPGSVSVSVDIKQSATSITLQVPQDAKTGSIQLFADTAGGASWSNYSASFTVLPKGNPPTIEGFSPPIGEPGDPVTITGADFSPAAIVNFGCAANNCNNSKTVKQATDVTVSEDGKSITAVVPAGLAKGPAYIQVTQGSGTVYTATPFTEAPASPATYSPATSSTNPGDIGSPIEINGTGFMNDAGESVVTSVAFTSLGPPNKKGNAPTILVPATFEVVSPTLIKAVVPDLATDGPIKVFTTEGSAKTGNFYVKLNSGGYPAKPAWLGDKFSGVSALETAISTYRPYLVTSIAAAVETFLTSSGPAGRCVANGCPVPYGQTDQTQTSIASTVGMYAYNIVYALMGAPAKLDAAGQKAWNENVGDQVVALATQSTILTFISNTVASGVPAFGTDLGSTIGNAAATFVTEAFGNKSLATNFAPFLEALNLPTDLAAANTFLAKVSSDGINAALFSTFKPVEAQQALIKFFTDKDVQGILAASAASAVKVLLGLENPTWTGAPQPPANALADYLGQMAALKLLGDGSPYTPSLGDTISGAITGLIGNIGQTVAADAGEALVTFLNVPPLGDEQGVPTILADFTVNSLFSALQSGCEKTSTCKPLPFPNQPPLLESIAPAAGVAVTGLVNSLLSESDVLQSLGTFLTDLVPAVLANQGVQEDIEANITGTLGTELGQPIANTVLDLLDDTTVTGALTTFANTTFGAFLSSYGVVPTLADAAGTLATARLEDPATFAEVLKQVQSDLKTNAYIDDGVGAGITAGSAVLLGNRDFWVALNTALSSLVATVLTDTDVQSALAKQVSDAVEAQFKNNPDLGAFFGPRVGTLVVELVTNPVVGQGLLGVVDTLLTDFWGSDGVVDAFSVAFGTLATASLAGTLGTVGPEVLQSLQANLDVQAALANSFGDATTEFLGDRNLWSAVDGTVSAAVIELTTDPAALALLDQAVQATITAKLGEPLAGVVGPQIGAAVVSLISGPVVAPALLGVVDTLFADFFGTDGVVEAFSTAASQWGLVLFTTLSSKKATQAAQQVLMNSDAVDNGVDVSVTAAVAELLGNRNLWAAVDQTVSTLAVTLLGDTEVQTALHDQVQDAVELRATGDLGTFLGDQLGNLVVALITNPVIQTGLLGVVDTLAVDFWTTPGVVAAFSQAAGDLAEAVLVGNFDEVSQQVQASLRANFAVESGVQNSVGDAVTVLLDDSDLWSAVDGTLSAAIIELTTNPVALNGLADAVSRDIAISLGEPLGSAVGPQVGAAVASLISDPAVVPALLGVVETLFSDFFGTDGVVGAFSSAASKYALVLLSGGDSTEARKEAGQVLKDSDAVVVGIDVSVTAAVADLLGNRDLWVAVDQTLSTLAGTLLRDTAVQTAIHDQVQNAVELRATGDLGVFLGDQLGTLVVNLVTNPDIETGLLRVFNTLTSDFWTTPGVVNAFSEAAGALAGAALTGDLETVVPQIKMLLRDDADVQTAVQNSVGAAVGVLLSDTGLWTAVNQILSAAVLELTTNPVALNALSDAVSGDVESALGGFLGESLAGAIGPKVGAAVVSLVSNPIVSGDLIGVVDTLFSDFFGTPGVVDAFSGAAGEWALELLITGDRKAAGQAATDVLQASEAVDNAVDASVTAAVAELLRDSDLWGAVDQTVTSLLAGIITDPVVTAALYQTVEELVAANPKLPGDLGQAVGTQVATAVVALVTNADIGRGLGAVVDTLFTDFFGAEGVVDAFAGAAGALAKVAFTGGDVAAARKDIAKQLQENGEVDAAVRDSVGGAVTEFLSDRGFWGALDSVLSTFAVDLISDTVVQQAIGDLVATNVAGFLGGPAGPIVGQKVADAVLSLLTNPAIGTGVHALVDTLATDFFGTPGVTDAFGVAAGDLALVAFTGGSVKVELPTVLQGLRTDQAVDQGAYNAVSGGVSELLGDTGLWGALDSTLTSLVAGILGDTVVQQTLYQTVDTLVAGKIGGDLGAAVGPNVATAVLSLLTSPAIGGGLNNLVGTLSSGFFGAPGVISALSDAAGTLASAAVFGNLDEVQPQVVDELRNNGDVDAAVRDSVDAAVVGLLSDRALWGALDSTLSTLASGLLNEPAVQTALAAQVASFVEQKVGGPAGAIVGAKVGAAVAQLLADPAVEIGVRSLVDTLFTDFFRSTGVVDAFGVAAGDLAMVAFVGGDETATILQALRTNPDVDAGVYNAISAGVTDLLTDTGLWTALDSTLTSLVVSLAEDPVVLQALYQAVDDAVTGSIGGDLGAAVGPPVATAVVELFTSPAIRTGLNDLVDTLFSDFFSAQGVISTLSDAAGQLASSAVFGDLDEKQPIIIESVRTNTDIDNAVYGAVNAGVSQLLSNTDLWTTMDTIFTQLVGGLISEPAVQDALSAQITTAASQQLGDELGAVVGPQVATAVISLMRDPALGGALQQLTDTVFSDFFKSPNVISTISDAAGTYAEALVYGNADEVGPGLIYTVRNSEVIDSAVDGAVSAGMSQFLDDADAVQAISGTVTELVTNLLDNSVVQTAAGNAAGSAVSGFIGSSPLAAPVSQAVSVAVQQFLATAGVAGDLGAIIGSLMPEFLGQPGANAGLSSAAGNFAAALVSGQGDPIQIALGDLKANAEVVAALKATVADALNQVDTTILSDPAIQESLGSITSNLVESLATNAEVRDYVAKQYGAAVAGLLTNTAVVGEISTQLGSAVTQLIGYPGVTTAITDALDLLANEVIDGTNESVALGDALKSLRANPDFVAGVNAVIPPTVNTILADPAVLAAIDVVAQQQAISALQGFGIKNKFLDKIAGQVAKGAAQSFLTRKAGIGLVDDLAVNLVLGLPFSGVYNFIGQEILHKPALQIALGFSIGQGIGSLFGDNIVGRLIGTVAGFPATITIGVASGLLNFYAWLSEGWAVAPVVGPAQTVPAAQGSLFVMDAQPAPTAVVSDGQFTLAGLGVTEPDDDQPGSVDITMTVDAGGQAARAPMIVSFRFPLDRLVAALEPMRVSAAAATELQVS